MNARDTSSYNGDDRKAGKIIRVTMGGFAAIAALIFGLSAMLVVPAPNGQTAAEVSGTLISISGPSPEYGDIEISLDNGRRYYINRADQVTHLDWKRMLAEVQPGDEIQLIVVTPLVWRMIANDASTGLPVAGLRTGNAIYMDAEIAATTWDSQRKFSGIALFSFVLLMACLLPDFLCFSTSARH